MAKMKTKDYRNTKIAIKSTVACALACAFMCVCAMISIPFAVPVTMQSFALFFCLFYLGAKSTVVSVLLYILMGVLGVPVFSGFSCGFSRLLDATGGFIMGLLVSALVYLGLTLLLPKCEALKVISSVVAHLVLYLCGTLWYSFVYLGGAEGSFAAAILACVVPFLLPDAAKLFLAYVLAKRLPRLK